jgi:hypothetical protein
MNNEKLLNELLVVRSCVQSQVPDASVQTQMLTILDKRINEITDELNAIEEAQIFGADMAMDVA